MKKKKKKKLKSPQNPRSTYTLQNNCSVIFNLSTKKITMCPLQY